jgi:two-component system, LytTR family, response regulator
MIRTVIVDDEALAREKVRQLLAAEADTEVVAQAADGRQAVAAIRTHAPDLVFLDVRMPGLDAFGVIEEIGAENFPPVIFVTAYDDYALKAFDVNAVDYLLKPVGRPRFQRALERARQQRQAPEPAALAQQLAALLADVRSGEQCLERLLIRSGDRLVLVRVEDIDWIDGAGNYLKLHSGKSTYLLRHTLGGLEARLDARKFLRIHRSTIVNVDRIAELQSSFSGDYVVILRDGTRLALSRTYRGKIEALAG